MGNRITEWIYNLKYKIYRWRMKRKYPDWTDDEYHCGSLKFVWGIKSCDDFSSGMPNIDSMNDIEITYDYTTSLFSLGIETAYLFESKADEANYLNRLLEHFTQFMVAGGHDTNGRVSFFMSRPYISCEADTIEELYTQFRIYVEGFKAVYGGESDA